MCDFRKIVTVLSIGVLLGIFSVDCLSDNEPDYSDDFRTKYYANGGEFDTANWNTAEGYIGVGEFYT